jgi:hypothetical protein
MHTEMHEAYKGQETARADYSKRSKSKSSLVKDTVDKVGKA